MKRLFVYFLSLCFLSTVLSHEPALAKMKGKSFTKTVAGTMYKLTQPEMLKMGAATLELAIMDPKTGKVIQGVQFTAEFYMPDGMKTPVKLTKNKDGSFKLQTQFAMAGEWTLRLNQTKPMSSEKKLEPFRIKVE